MSPNAARRCKSALREAARLPVFPASFSPGPGWHVTPASTGYVPWRRAMLHIPVFGSGAAFPSISLRLSLHRCRPAPSASEPPVRLQLNWRGGTVVIPPDRDRTGGEASRPAALCPSARSGPYYASPRGPAAAEFSSPVFPPIMRCESARKAASTMIARMVVPAATR
jgi:hypothetical protein